MENNGNEKKGKIKPSQVITIFLLLAVLIVGIIIVLLLTRKPDPVEETQPKDRVVTPQNVDEINKQLKETKPDVDAYYHVEMNVEWNFNSKGETTNAYVNNATDNYRTVYFDLILISTGETIYSSDLIPVGSNLKGFTLDKPLDPGEYEAEVLYHLLDDNNKEITTTAVNVNMNVSK